MKREPPESKVKEKEAGQEEGEDLQEKRKGEARKAWEEEVKKLHERTVQGQAKEVKKIEDDAIYLQAAREYIVAKRLIEQQLGYKTTEEKKKFNLELIGHSDCPSIEGKVKTESDELAIILETAIALSFFA